MQLDDEQRRILRRLRKAPADFATLVKLAGLDPRQDFRGVSLRGVDFGRADVSDFDFTGADLSGADLRRATVGGALEAAGCLDGVRLPAEEIADRRPHMRSYQRAAVEAVTRHLDEGGRRALVSMPTGAGKTTVMGEIIDVLRERGRLTRALILVDSRGLANQTVHTLASRYPSLRVSRYSGQSDWMENDIIVAAAKQGYVPNVRILDFIASEMRAGGGISHLLFDDVSRLPKSILNYATSSSISVVGFVAKKISMGRLLGSSVSRLFQDALIFEYDLSDAIREGYAVPVDLKDRRGRFNFEFDSSLSQRITDHNALELRNMLIEELFARVETQMDASIFCTVFLVNDYYAACELFDFILIEIGAAAQQAGETSDIFSIKIYDKSRDGANSGDRFLEILVCPADQLNRNVMSRCDRIAVLCREVPKILPSVMLTSTRPRNRTVIDYAGGCVDAFHQFAGGQDLDHVVRVDNDRKPRQGTLFAV